MNKNLKHPVKNKDKQDDYERELWKTLLLSLAKRSFDERDIIADRSHEILFSLLKNYNSAISVELWNIVFHDLLRAIFDDLDVSIQNHEHSNTDTERHIHNAERMVTDFVEVIKDMDETKFGISIMIFIQIVKNFIFSNPDSPLGQELLKGLIELIKRTGNKFDSDLWKTIITAICKLCDETLAKSLLGGQVQEESKTDSERSGSRVSHRAIKPGNLSNVQSIQQLLLISSIENIVEHYQTLEYEEIMKLLEKVKSSYELAHSFNINIERRVEVLQNRTLPSKGNVLPGLIKQERLSLKIYLAILFKLYSDPKEELSKGAAADLILAFSTQVLKDYSKNYEEIIKSGKDHDDSIATKESDQFEIDLRSKNEEINKILVSLSSIVGESVFKTLAAIDDEDMEKHIRDLAPILIDLTISDQLTFRIRLREVLKKCFKKLI